MESGFAHTDLSSSSTDFLLIYLKWLGCGFGEARSSPVPRTQSQYPRWVTGNNPRRRDIDAPCNSVIPMLKCSLFQLFSISNNDTLDEPHWLWYWHWAKFLCFFFFFWWKIVFEWVSTPKRKCILYWLLHDMTIYGSRLLKSIPPWEHIQSRLVRQISSLFIT